MRDMCQAIEDLARFGKVVKLKAFIPFTSAQLALENINSISEGMMQGWALQLVTAVIL